MPGEFVCFGFKKTQVLNTNFLFPGVVTAAPAAAAKDCDPNQKRIRPFVFLTSSDQTTSRLIYVFLHYDDMKAFIMFLWSKTIFLQMVDILILKC